MIQNVDEEPEVERQEKIKKLKKQLQLLLEESEPKIYQFQQMTHYMTKQYCNYKFHQRMKNGIENNIDAYGFIGCNSNLWRI